ncbi:TetR/AcrR family transcriptional regulator [Streptomyces sp. CC224E]|uniref:TetR/AcrR family transcriptional regulator n=1 Tax=Streptomyces sp. CC224E TaxID=3044174 RepID=UPI00278BC119|nr:TetR/AcrR family transcriptional regulator [Streptomyces sp. CC224E]
MAAADDLFDERGTEVPLDDVVRRAGLGSGTLYRHFATRDALLAAVFWERIAALCKEAENLLAAESPMDGIVVWLRSLIRLTMRRGLAAALAADNKDGGSELFRYCREALDGAAAPLLERAKAAGSFAPELEVSDLITFTHAIAVAAERAPDGAEHADRLLRLLLDGLRTREDPLRAL